MASKVFIPPHPIGQKLQLAIIGPIFSTNHQFHIEFYLEMKRRSSTKSSIAKNQKVSPVLSPTILPLLLPYLGTDQIFSSSKI
jgi:hypothetical protein